MEDLKHLYFDNRPNSFLHRMRLASPAGQVMRVLRKPMPTGFHGSAVRGEQQAEPDASYRDGRGRLTGVCAKLGIGISVLEPLISGGIHIVLNNKVDAADLRKRLKTSLIDGPVLRSPNFISRQTIPYI